MATRGDKLNRLVIGSPCTSSWDEMEGEGARRRCAECKKDVFDFARMTRREIEARIQATRGQLCARLTRKEGQLVMAEGPIVPLPPSVWSRQRASPFVATVVTAWLGLDARSARAGEPAASAATLADSSRGDAAAAVPGLVKPKPAANRAAALRGRIGTEDGRFLAGAEVSLVNALDGREYAALTSEDGFYLVDSLPTGIYDVNAAHDGFTIEGEREIALQAGESRTVDLLAEVDEGVFTVGAMGIDEDPMRQLFAESDFVVSARRGVSRVLGRHDGLVEVETELRVDSTVKGELRGNATSYRRSLPESSVSPDGTIAEMDPGGRVVAFLKAKREAGPKGSESHFELAGSYGGVKALEDAEGDAYLKRLEALARLMQKAESGRETDPAEVVEWLVATAEEPTTRKEAVGDLAQALGALRERARVRGTTLEQAAQDLRALVERFRAEGGRTTAEPRPALLGAAVTAAQEKRLTRALLATERLEDSDGSLFWIVRQWDETTARRWLVRQLRTMKPQVDEDNDFWRLQNLAYQLEDETLQELAERASARFNEIGGRPWDQNEPRVDAGLAHQQRREVYADLLRDFARALSKTP